MKKENWIKWDLDSRSGVKMSAFFGEYGATGYGVFLFFIESLYRNDEHKLGLSTGEYDAYAAACKLTVEQIRDILNSLFNYNLFQYSEDGYFWSNRVIEEIKEREEQRKAQFEQRSTAGKLGALKKWGNKSNSINNIMANDSNPMAMVSNAIAEDGRPMAMVSIPLAKDGKRWQTMARLDKIRLDNINPPHIPPLGESSDFEKLEIKKSKSKKTKKSIDKYLEFCEADFVFPEKWGAKSKQALKDWIEFKHQQGTAKLLISYQKEIDGFAKTPQRFHSLVYRAISKNWQGLNEHVPFVDSEDGGFQETPSSKYQVITDSNGNELEVEFVGGVYSSKK